MKVQGDHEFGAAQRSTGMSALTLMHHANDIATHLARNSLELGDIRHIKIKDKSKN